MPSRVQLRGHEITWSGSEWVYADTGEPTIGNPRPCAHCGAPNRPDGHDACLGDLGPGVTNACCGHGHRAESYVQFANGIVVRDFVLERSKQSRRKA